MQPGRAVELLTRRWLHRLLSMIVPEANRISELDQSVLEESGHVFGYKSTHQVVVLHHVKIHPYLK